MRGWGSARMVGRRNQRQGKDWCRKVYTKAIVLPRKNKNNFEVNFLNSGRAKRKYVRDNLQL